MMAVAATGPARPHLTGDEWAFTLEHLHAGAPFVGEEGERPEQIEYKIPSKFARENRKDTRPEFNRLFTLSGITQHSLILS